MRLPLRGPVRTRSSLRPPGRAEWIEGHDGSGCYAVAANRPWWLRTGEALTRRGDGTWRPRGNVHGQHGPRHAQPLPGGGDFLDPDRSLVEHRPECTPLLGARALRPS